MTSRSAVVEPLESIQDSQVSIVHNDKQLVCVFAGVSALLRVVVQGAADLGCLLEGANMLAMFHRFFTEPPVRILNTVYMSKRS